MGTKAKLSVILMADSTVVAESDNTVLWQSVLAAIQDSSSLPPPPGDRGRVTSEDLAGDEAKGGDKAIVNFAKTLGVSLEVLTAALSPSRETPYLHLDHHCWAQMKKATPKRGAGSLSATGLAGTLLALWLKEAKMDFQATQALAGEVLNTISVRDPNASRGIKNTKWLQGRSGGTIVINAAEIAKAIDIARSFCTKQWAAGSTAT